MENDRPFNFKISLSVLNYLGRQLYRSFATVLGEAISNAWDADANNVWLYVDRKKKCLFVKDDGIGMNAGDFQDKFLKVGYSKRQNGKTHSKGGRPYIGRKGIGKLALLSCADKITVISKVEGKTYIGGSIDNSELDKAITDDLTPQDYPLGEWKAITFANHTQRHKHGTIIKFENIKDGIKNSLPLLRKIIALYFRFSLIDNSFNIFLEDDKITCKDLDELATKTEFLWKIGDLNDPFVDGLERMFSQNPLEHEKKKLNIPGIEGFIASVKKPRYLKIITTEERVGIDLFVNGRLREKDILKHIPTAQLPENYLYGQVHFDALDDSTDRFTTSREGIVADDPKYAQFLKKFKGIILKIVTDWDGWRVKHREEGDPENESISKKERSSRGLFNVVSKDFELPEKSKKRNKVDGWVFDLSDDAAFNFESYAECFISENLVRKFIQEKSIPLSSEAKAEAAKWRNTEKENKNKGNISIRIRRISSDLSYLDMNNLANLVDKKDKVKDACLARDAAEYKPIRDAVAHTALLTDEAKHKLRTVRVNIKGRVKTLLSKSK